MKKLFFAVSALAALSLLAPSAGFAQHEFSNQVGLYLTADGTGATGTMTVGAPVNIFLVLTKPTDVEDAEAPVPFIYAYELMLNFNPAGGLFKTGEVFPPTAMNLGDNQHLNDGYLEYVVAMSEGLPVTDESASLLQLQFIPMVATPIYVTLAPPFIPSIGTDDMAFMPISPELRAMYSAGGSVDDPVFTFNVVGDAVAVDEASFGSVKALYR